MSEQTTSDAGQGGDELAALRRYRQAADYLAAAQMRVRSNALLRRALTRDDLKPRPVGEWRSVPSIDLVYAHLDRLVRARDLRVLLVTGPGHGAAANLANMYLDGSLAEFYPEMAFGADGLDRFVGAFAWPGGFSDHLTPELPGTIDEGAELGHALATAFGAALDDPELLVVCIVGDEEAETGPTAASWSCNRYLDPATSGAVLPILAISGGSPTIAAAMSDEELMTVYRGFGYEPTVVDGNDAGPDGLDAAMAAALDQAADDIAELQQRARSGATVTPPRWPMLVLRMPQGWVAVREESAPADAPLVKQPAAARGGSPLDRHRPELVQASLESRRPELLFDEDGAPAADIRAFGALGERRLAMTQAAIGGLVRKPLELPDAASAAVPVSQRGVVDAAGLEQTARYVAGVMRRSADERNFRIFSPEPLESNGLGAILDTTERAFTWPTGPIAPAGAVSPAGRVVEVRSEHIAEGLLEGYLKTGRHGLFVSSEAFIRVVDAEIGEFARWLRASNGVNWRPPISSLNLLLTSDGSRGGHAGSDHQNAGFINSLLSRRSSVLRITLPPDANTLVETIARCLHSTGYINLVVAPRQRLPQWLPMSEARAHATAGASIWRWASSNEGIDPDVVLACAGAVPTIEVLAARELLARDLPDLAVRVVNVMDLMRLDSRGGHPHALNPEAFEALFTAERHVIFSFHGHPSAIHQLISGRPEPRRFHVRGYAEEGGTTTPFDVLVRNGTSRYQLAIDAIRRAGRVTSGGSGVIDRYLLKLEEHQAYIREHGEDPAEITDWRWGAA